MSAQWETVNRPVSRWRRLAGAGVVAVGGVAVVAMAVSGNAEPRSELVVEDATPPAATPSPTAPAVPVSPGQWQTLAAGPLSPRQDSAAAWTGTELLVWGGRLRDELGTLDDGAAYEPVGDRWRQLPDSPLSPRGSPASVWTGTEFIVWGGGGDQPDIETEHDPMLGIPLGDGAAYNPATNRWRELPPSPLSPRRGARAVWAADVVVIWGGTGYAGGSHFTDGAVYDPANDTWTELPRSPLHGRDDTDLDVAAVGDHMFVMASSHRGIATALYDAAAGKWTAGIGTPPLRGDVPVEAAAVGDSVLVWGEAPTPARSAMAFLYSPADREWRTVDRPPRAPNRAGGLAPAGQSAVAWERSTGLTFDAGTRSWATMPDPPALRDGVAVQAWTGDRLLLWDTGGLPHDPSRGAAWVPAPLR